MDGDGQEHRPLVVVSNRGPLAFAFDGDAVTTTKAAGGLATALGPAVAGRGATWIAAAITDADRAAAAGGTAVEAEGFRLELLRLDEDLYRAYYDVVANATLWFLNHGLFDHARRPRLDRRWREAWAAYREVNEAFADAVADIAPASAVVLVHDYHLSLVGGRLAKSRPDLRSAYFHHTPFCGPDALRVLPDDVRRELLAGLAGYSACGFHSRRWAEALEACFADDDDAPVAPRTFVSPASPDFEELRGVASSAESDAAVRALDDVVGDRLLVVRVDRIELSKNLLRGFLAFEELLETHPEWRERVVFAAFVYPSRQGLAEYLAYHAEVESLVERINERWATPGWQPIVMDPADDFASSVAGLRRYDLLLVNPIRDGLNLVAKEGPVVNERDGVVALSRESGAWDELGSVALAVNPFDVTGTSEVIHTGLTLSRDERAQHARALREAALRRTPSDWLRDQIAAASA